MLLFFELFILLFFLFFFPLALTLSLQLFIQVVMAYRQCIQFVGSSLCVLVITLNVFTVSS
jgi:hypothetical protein